MIGILTIIAPVFLIIGAGYLAAKFGAITVPSAEILLKLAQRFAIPCLLFMGVSQVDLGAVFDFGLLASFYAGAFTSFILGVLGARFIFGRRPGEAVAVGFCALFSNSLLLGIPITERAYGAEALAPNFAIISIHAPILFTLGVVSMEIARADGAGTRATIRQITRAMARNELVMGISAGLFVNLTGLPLPAPVWAATEMLGRAGLPIALFAIGAVLTSYTLRREMGEAAMVALLSLLLHPLIAFGLGTQVFALSEGHLRSAVVTAAMAPGINAYLFANMYDRAKSTAASAVLLGTALSIASVSFWLMILGS